MGYLSRNVNLALLVIIIGVVVALVGTTVFFQRGLQNRTDEYQQTSTSLDACKTALANYQEKYSVAAQKVNETTQSVRQYDQLYEQKVGELKDTQGQLQQSQQQAAFEKLAKEKFQQFYESLLRDSTAQNLTIQSQQARINSLENRIDDLEDRLDACGG